MSDREDTFHHLGRIAGAIVAGSGSPYVGSDIVERIIVAEQARIAIVIRQEYDNAPGDSPIEKALHTAIWAALAHRPNNAMRLLPCLLGAAGPSEFSDTTQIYIADQVQIGKRRVDFVLFAHDGQRWRRLIIECDGHDFHEKTKDQVAADQSFNNFLTLSGEQFLRFTGSQIFNSPMSCANDILRWADKTQAGL